MLALELDAIPELLLKSLKSHNKQEANPEDLNLMGSTGSIDMVFVRRSSASTAAVVFQWQQKGPVCNCIAGSIVLHHADTSPSYQNQIQTRQHYNLSHVMRYNHLPLFLILLLSLMYSKPIFDFSKSYVIRLTDFNLNDQIHKIRRSTNQVSLVLFYKYDDGKSKEFADSFDKWTNEYRGIFRIAAIDCDEYENICKNEDVIEYPTIKVYPPIPMPIAKYEGQLKTEAIQKFASRYLHSNVIEITNSNIKTFLAENPSVPKVLLFTDKKGVPMTYKGLSVNFEKKLTFGIVRNTDEVLTGRYAIKQFPSLIVIKTGEKKPFEFKGKYEFPELFDFLNIYSEVFVPGGGSSHESQATKQWMTQSLPQLNGKSANDICLQTDHICGIYLAKGKPDAAKTKTFEQLTALYDPKIDRGAKFKFMWLNTQVEKKWAELLGYAGEDKFIFLMPGKRKRFATHEGDITKDSIRNSIEKIIGGDGRFTRIAEYPKFQVN